MRTHKQAFFATFLHAFESVRASFIVSKEILSLDGVIGDWWALQHLRSSGDQTHCAQSTHGRVRKRETSKKKGKE